MLINITEFLEKSAKTFPQKTALICGKKHYSYQEISHTSNQLAGFFYQSGVVKGDRIVISHGNTYETVIAFWAALKANAIASIISNELPPSKTAYILKDSGAKFHFSADIQLSKLHHEKLTAPRRQTLDIDLASIIYTSGSTGEPKGVMMTHRNMLTAANSIGTYLGNQASDIILCALPLSFDYGLYQLIMAFAVGATLVLEKNFLLPSQTLRKIAQEKVTALPCVPSMLPRLIEFNKLTNYDLSSVRYVTNTGAALSPKHIELIQALFPNTEIFSMYGLTECKRCTYLPPQDIKRKPGSVGIAIPNTEMWVVDENDNKLAPNQKGQLVIRGATVMQGYWNKPEQTAAKLKLGKYPNEKVLYTGDYAVIDDEGYLYYKGRMDEVIKSRGLKVSPKEIEDVVMTIPGIKEAAVIGIPDESLGEAIHLFTVTENHIVLSKEQILTFCKGNLENYKLPAKITLCDALPKSINGKIDKLALAGQLR